MKRMDLNTISISGNLVADALIKGINQSQSDILEVCKFRIASNHRKDTVLFVNCTIFGAYALKMVPYLTKSKKVIVTGRLEISSYKTDSQETRYSTEIIATNVILIGGKE